LQRRREVAAFKALFEGRANAILKALNAPEELVKSRLFGLLSHKSEDLVVKATNVVFATGRKMIRFTSLPGEVKAMSDPIFDDFGGYLTIMVNRDLFAFRASYSEAMLVVQYMNAN